MVDAASGRDKPDRAKPVLRGFITECHPAVRPDVSAARPTRVGPAASLGICPFLRAGFKRVIKYHHVIERQK
jgi:hypothetical protein